MNPLEDSGVTAVGHVIQLSVAPVFLLSAIGALLTVLTNRLGRIIDRARVLEARLDDYALETAALAGTAADHPHSHAGATLTAAADVTAGIRAELDVLSLRGKLIHRAITLSVVTAVLVCSVIVALFVGAFVRVDVSAAVALLFVGAMVSFLGALLTLMRELFSATSSLSFGRR